MGDVEVQVVVLRSKSLRFVYHTCDLQDCYHGAVLIVG